MALKDLMARTPAPAPEPARIDRFEPPPVAVAQRPAPATPAPVESTHLGASTAISGQLRSMESLRIDGRVKGEIYCDETLTIGESGRIEASIEGDIVVIAGEVRGDITARRKITLERTARVTGDLSTPGIVIQEGAMLEGRIMIGGDAKSEAQKSAAEAAPRGDAAKPARPSTSPPPPAG